MARDPSPMGGNDIRLIYKAISSSAGRTRTCNQWINSPAQTSVQPVCVVFGAVLSTHFDRSWCLVLSCPATYGYIFGYRFLGALTRSTSYRPLPSTHQPGRNSIDSMMGAVSAMTSSKRSSGATTVIARV